MKVLYPDLNSLAVEKDAFVYELLNEGETWSWNICFLRDFNDWESE